MILPNFLIIGAGKSGTSALWHYLQQHPDIYMSPKKEPHFLAFENKVPYAAGPGDYTKHAITNIHDYYDLFSGVMKEKVIGEASTTTLYFPGAVKRVQKYLPHAKMIAILRHPADRAYSAYMHLIRDNRESSEDFADALRLENGRIAQKWAHIWHYTKMGYYFEQLTRFYDRFDENQIRIYLYEDFRAEPLYVVKDIFSFLEINESFVPDTRVKYNVSGMPKSGIIQALIQFFFDRPNPVKSIARRLLDKRVRQNLTERIRNQNLIHQTIPKNIRRELIEMFRDDIQNLQDLIQRDLTHWLNTN